MKLEIKWKCWGEKALLELLGGNWDGGEQMMQICWIVNFNFSTKWPLDVGRMQKRTSPGIWFPDFTCVIFMLSGECKVFFDLNSLYVFPVTFTGWYLAEVISYLNGFNAQLELPLVILTIFLFPSSMFSLLTAKNCQMQFLFICIPAWFTQFM